MSTQSRHGPITRRVIEALRRQMRMKVVDLATFRAGQEYAEALQNLQLPEMKSFVKQIGPAEKVTTSRRPMLSVTRPAANSQFASTCFVIIIHLIQRRNHQVSHVYGNLCPGPSSRKLV